MIQLRIEHSQPPYNVFIIKKLEYDNHIHAQLNFLKKLFDISLHSGYIAMLFELASG